MERIKTEDSINIFEFVRDLRKQRVLMVQTPVKAITYAICGNEIGSTSHCPVATIVIVTSTVFVVHCRVCMSPFHN